MNRLKKFWIVFCSFLPFGAMAVPPLLIGGIAAAVGIVGFSIYRSSTPVNMSEALQFLSSCWTCQLFADIMSTMSNILPKVYNELGKVIIPFTIILTAIWIAWKLLTGYFNNKIEDPWSITSTFGMHFLKMGVVCVLLVAPLPRMVTQIAIEPIFNVGMSLNRMVVHDDKFDTCVIASAIADPLSASSKAAEQGAFSPRLRHNLACELGGVHQVTGLGMTIGWTMLNMAFDGTYMHKVLNGIPIFPNVPIFCAGVLIFILFFAALLPIPMYFLEIFITLAMDLVMLPLMLLAWLFKGWAISLKGAGQTIRGIIDRVISGTLGLAITGVFLSFAVMFLNAVFGDIESATVLETALKNNDATILMDGLMMRNDSIITIVMMGIFITMFMTMIPALAKTLFSVEISDKFYKTAKSNVDTLWKGVKTVYSRIKK
ncbi:MAG: hypothetical protein J6K82_03465 [Alphaproteobacteria bacterium]|nr:hypothetical protein [Alphaproteobacteria bacterium]